MITITETAIDQIDALMNSKDRGDLALRVAIRGRGPGGFLYQLQFVPEDSRSVEDEVLDTGKFQVFIDPDSVSNIKGSTLDFVEDVMERGFKIDNPNPLWKDPLANAVQAVLDNQINPAVAGHGGFVTLLDVRDHTAFVALGGGCQGCGLANVTLKQGIEVMIKEAVPEITQVIDSTDHAAGQNPFYQPAKGGQSPLEKRE